MRVVLVVAALWANVALAQQAAEPDYLKWGVMLDAGLPDGAGLSAVYRPFTFLRANAGFNYNVLGFGVSGGVSLVPFYAVFTPSLNVEVGRFFQSDVTALAKKALPNTDLSNAGAALQHVGYDYGTAQLGLEFGPPRQFTFFLRVGISYIQTTVDGFQQALQNAVGDSSISAKPLAVKGTIPSAKLGAIFYF